jgi:multidrug resistance efflux pump
VDTKLSDLNNTAAKDAYKITLAQADADRKVALAKCEALSGDALKNCKSLADAEYEAVKANAKAAEVSEKQ